MRKYLAVIALFLTAVFVGSTMAQTVSNTVAVPVSLTLPESISLGLSTNTITLSSTAPSQTIVLTPAWMIQSGHSTATIYSWLSVLPTFNGNTISPGALSTTFNSGTQVFCSGSPAWPSGIGLGGSDCGSFSIPNIGTDLNDSQSVNFTVTFTDTHTFAVGSYTGGILNLAFQIV
jgi:hypothetical protein